MLTAGPWYAGSDIALAYMFRSAGQWWIRADFRTHNNHETWTVDALCINKAHPVVRYQFKGLGDNVDGYNTFISGSAYECGVAGFAARSGDINEDGDGDPILVYLFPSGGTWAIRTDLRSRNNSESWDVDVLRVQR